MGLQVIQFACRVLKLFKDDEAANLWKQLASEACVKVGVSSGGPMLHPGPVLFFSFRAPRKSHSLT